MEILKTFLCGIGVLTMLLLMLALTVATIVGPIVLAAHALSDVPLEFPLNVVVCISFPCVLGGIYLIGRDFRNT
jgi:hypothetical protein